MTFIFSRMNMLRDDIAYLCDVRRAGAVGIVDTAMKLADMHEDDLVDTDYEGLVEYALDYLDHLDRQEVVA